MYFSWGQYEMNRYIIFGLSILLLMTFVESFGQGRVRGDRQQRRPEMNVPSPSEPQQLIERRTAEIGSPDQASVFRAFQQGFLAGDAASFSSYFAPQVYISLRSSESGYFSASQAYYVLQNYFVSHRIHSLAFTTYGESEIAPYATGPGRLEMRGGIEQVQVYVSLTRTGTRWMISQINIY